MGFCFGLIRARRTSSEVLLRLIPGDAIFLLIPQYNKAFLSLYLRHTHDLASLSVHRCISPLPPPPQTSAIAFLSPGPWRARATYKVSCLLLRVLDWMGWHDYSQKLKIYLVQELMLMHCMGIFILIYPLQRLIWKIPIKIASKIIRTSAPSGTVRWYHVTFINTSSARKYHKFFPLVHHGSGGTRIVFDS